MIASRLVPYLGQGPSDPGSVSIQFAPLWESIRRGVGWHLANSHVLGALLSLAILVCGVRAATCALRGKPSRSVGASFAFGATILAEIAGDIPVIVTSAFEFRLGMYLGLVGGFLLVAGAWIAFRRTRGALEAVAPDPVSTSSSSETTEGATSRA